MADLCMFRANDRTWTLTFKDTNEDPISLVGATILMTVKNKDKDSDADAVFQKRVTSHTDATSGISAVTVTKTDSAVDVGQYYYDMKLIDAAGNNTTIPGGLFIIKRDITQSTS